MSSREKGSVQLVLLIAVLALIFTAALIPVKRSYNDGKSSVAGIYLAKGGDEGSSGGSEDNSSGGSSSSGGSPTSGSSGNSGSSGSSGDSSTAIKTTTVVTTPKPEKIETKETQEVKQNEKENEAIKEVESELEKADVKIATAPGQIALVNKNTGALTNFPLSVDPTTRQLTVTTPAGIKVVAVLPQQAVDNMLASHVADVVEGEKVNNSLASIPNLVNLEVRGGVLGYDIKGIKNHKLLGFIPINTSVDAFVSAENGQVVETNESLLGRVLNRIAP